MISQAGGNDEQSGISWFIYTDAWAGSWVGEIIKLPIFGWDWVGMNDNAPFQMKNNVNLITKTPCKGVSIYIKIMH